MVRKRAQQKDDQNFEKPNRSSWRPLNEAQASLFEFLSENHVTLICGPAGTAKTTTAVAWAQAAMNRGEYEKIVFTRPIVEATESLGWLPGTTAEKLAPFMRPLVEAATKTKVKESVVETIPLAYMRGLTLSNCIGILDEAQNCTLSQLKLYLSRLGRDSRLIICGDTDQADIRDSGFREAITRLNGIRGIGIFEFSEKDIVRHPLVSAILKRLS